MSYDKIPLWEAPIGLTTKDPLPMVLDASPLSRDRRVIIITNYWERAGRSSGTSPMYVSAAQAAQYEVDTARGAMLACMRARKRTRGGR